MRSRYPRPLHAVPPHVAAALTGGGGATAPTVYAGLRRANLGDDVAIANENFVRTSDMTYLFLLDVSAFDHNAYLYDEGRATGAPIFGVRLENAATDRVTFVTRRDSGAYSTRPRDVGGSGDLTTYGPLLAWARVQAGAAPVVRAGLGATGTNEGTDVLPSAVSIGDQGAAPQLFRDSANVGTDVAAHLAVFVLDGWIGDAAIDAIAAAVATSMEAGTSEALARIASSGLTLKLHPRATAATVATAADIEDAGDGSFTWALVEGGGDLEGVPL